MSFNVIQPGILSLVQDAGRFGKHNIGLTNGGPLDKISFDWANRLLGNDPNACVIEVSIGGLQLEATVATQIAFTGGDAQLSINQIPVSSWCTHAVNSGDKISIGFAQHSTRHYLAVKDGFDIKPMFGSCSTVAREKIGGLNGKALETGDVLPCSTYNSDKQLSVATKDRPIYTGNITLRVILGYQHEAFDNVQKARFFNSEFTISDKVDRMGFRLSGPEIKSSLDGILSEGICYGAIQVPADGQPIILVNDRQTIGGYPKIGSVLSLDISKLTQRLAGTKINFEPITIDHAQTELLLAQFRYTNAVLVKTQSK